jgi:hypothetical protein
MSNVIWSTLIVAAAGALLAGCAQPPPPVQALPPGPTPAEVIDYATAQAQYRAAKASGNGDAPIARRSRANLRPRSRSASVIDRLL